MFPAFLFPPLAQIDHSKTVDEKNRKPISEVGKKVPCLSAG
jgi:hypothetical protein